MRAMKIAFVTNICPHYRVQTFETLARHHEVDYYFFSAGDEWYWQQQHGVQRGAFRHTYLPGVRLGGTRVTPTLPIQLLAGGYDAYIKCVNGRFALPITYLVARLRRKPFILWTGIWQRIDTPAHRLFYPLTRYLYRHADAVAVYGEHVRRFLIGEGVRAERIFVANHAIDNDGYAGTLAGDADDALRQRLGARPGQPIVLYLGRLEESKGIAYLLAGFAALRGTDALLVIAGDGAARGGLEQQAAALGLSDRVRFIGYVPQAEAWKMFAVASVAVVPSITTATFKEPWGLVVNEAFNQGTPVIASAAVGAAAGGLLRHGQNGLVVPERDSAAIARALQLLLDQPALRRQLGQNAAAEVASWTNERMVQGFLSAVAYACAHHGGGQRA
jgi:glycosyltransferase involved in cell wall biosynthesis